MHSTWFISTVFAVLLVAVVAATSDVAVAAVSWSVNGSGSWLTWLAPVAVAVPAPTTACLGMKLQQVESQLQILYFLFRFWVLFFCISWPKQQLTLSSNMRFMRQFVKRKWLLPRIIIVHHGGRNAIQSRQQRTAASHKRGGKVKCLLEAHQAALWLYYVYAESAKNAP